MSIDLNPKIYVACLAAYNDGYLHGCWIEVSQDIDAIYQEIQQMLSESPIPDAEEWAIHDYEGFGSLEISEYEGIESVCEKAEFIEEYDDLGAEVLGYYGDMESAKEALDDYYHGAFDSELDFATEIFDEIYAHDIPDNIRFYIDYEAFSRDLFINDYLSFDVGGKVHVFSQH